MRLKELLFAMANGERPELPNHLDGSTADIILYVRGDVSDEALHDSAVLAKHRHGNLHIVENRLEAPEVVEVEVEVENPMDAELIEKIKGLEGDLKVQVERAEELEADLEKTDKKLKSATKKLKAAAKKE